MKELNTECRRDLLLAIGVAIDKETAILDRLRTERQPPMDTIKARERQLERFRQLRQTFLFPPEQQIESVIPRISEEL
jgi:hypothetical protein